MSEESSGGESPFDPETALLLRAVAHDFNNLLSSVMGHAELLEATSGSDAALARRCRAIRRAALKGVDITRKLSGAGRDLDLHLEDLDTQELLAEEAKRFQDTLREGVVLQVEGPGTVSLRADRRAFHQITSALLANARAWCTAPGWVRLTLQETEGGVALSVTDSGPGFSDALSDEDLFAPFVGTGREGSGLGLWLVRRLVDAHGGSVQVRRGPNARVTCEFPAG